MDGCQINQPIERKAIGTEIPTGLQADALVGFPDGPNLGHVGIIEGAGEDIPQPMLLLLRSRPRRAFGAAKQARRGRRRSQIRIELIKNFINLRGKNLIEFS